MSSSTCDKTSRMRSRSGPGTCREPPLPERFPPLLGLPPLPLLLGRFPPLRGREPPLPDLSPLPGRPPPLRGLPPASCRSPTSYTSARACVANAFARALDRASSEMWCESRKTRPGRNAATISQYMAYRLARPWSPPPRPAGQHWLPMRERYLARNSRVFERVSVKNCAASMCTEATPISRTIHNALMRRSTPAHSQRVRLSGHKQRTGSHALQAGDLFPRVSQEHCEVDNSVLVERERGQLGRVRHLRQSAYDVLVGHKRVKIRKVCDKRKCLKTPKAHVQVSVDGVSTRCEPVTVL